MPRARIQFFSGARVFLALVAIAGFSTAVRAQETLVALDPAQTKITFTVDTTLHMVHGTFKMKHGEIRFDPATGKASGSIVVDAASGNSENEGRDKKMHQEVLESDKFSEIVFTPAEVHGKIAPAGTSEVEVPGTIRLLGKDHEFKVTFSVESVNGREVHASTHFTVPYKKWGLKNPGNFLLHVNDNVEVEIHAVGQLSTNPAPISSRARDCTQSQCESPAIFGNFRKPPRESLSWNFRSRESFIFGEV
jgi:polyisoprenoid-binding protein YceI